MCHSFEASASAGLFSYASAFILLNRNISYDRWFALFILSFSSIQWAEAILWKNLDNFTINEAMTSWGIPIILASEGIFGLIGASLYNDVNIYLWITYIIIALFIIFFTNKNKTTTVVDGSLRWNTDKCNVNNNEQDNLNITKYLPYILFAIYISLPFFLYMDNGLDKFVMISGIFGLLLYSMIYHSSTISSNWCYYANLLSLYALLRPYF